MTIGERIREARNAKGWTQRQLADRIDHDPITISRWETHQQAPSVDGLRRIARATGRSVDWFFEDVS